MKFTSFLSFIFILLGISSLGQAASVSQIKGAKALIELEGETLNEGDEYYLVNPETNKKTAIIKIKQIKNTKAVADIIKGKATVGSKLTAKSSAAASNSAGSSRGGATRASWGVIGQYIMNSMSASFTRSSPTTHTGTSTMSGSGFGAGAYYNYVLTPKFTVAVEGSVQQFNTTGTTDLADCDNYNSTTCSVNIMYLSGYAIARYYIPTRRVNYWLGGGAGFLLALSKSSTILNTSQISTNQVFSAAAGGDWELNKKNYVPFSLQYNLFPSSANVTANMIVLNVGYGWYF